MEKLWCVFIGEGDLHDYDCPNAPDALYAVCLSPETAATALVAAAKLCPQERPYIQEIEPDKPLIAEAA